VRPPGGGRPGRDTGRDAGQDEVGDGENEAASSSTVSDWPPADLVTPVAWSVADTVTV
jgi:hypothetical protein